MCAANRRTHFGYLETWVQDRVRPNSVQVPGGDALTLRLPAVVIGVALTWPASRRAPCEVWLERGLPSSK